MVGYFAHIELLSKTCQSPVTASNSSNWHCSIQVELLTILLDLSSYDRGFISNFVVYRKQVCFCIWLVCTHWTTFHQMRKTSFYHWVFVVKKNDHFSSFMQCELIILSKFPYFKSNAFFISVIIYFWN